MTFALTSTAAKNSAFDPIINTLRAIARKASERRMFHATRRELMALSDLNLTDLGLTRANIDRAALDATIGFAHR